MRPDPEVTSCHRCGRRHRMGWRLSYALFLLLAVASKSVITSAQTGAAPDKNQDTDTSSDMAAEDVQGQNQTVPVAQSSPSSSSGDSRVSDEDEVIDLDKEPAVTSTIATEVGDYLETLPTAELLQICQERGLALTPRADGQEWQRSDYLEAARRCLSLEKEMQAILATHPELAAELEAEIERMRLEKVRLEAEREAILAEKALLEAQLREAGVDIEAVLRTRGGSRNNVTLAAPQSLGEVLMESFRLLYERVAEDVRMVHSVLKPVVLPIGQAVQLLWRYLEPTLLSVFQRYYKLVKDMIVPPAQEAEPEKELSELAASGDQDVEKSPEESIELDTR